MFLPNLYFLSSLLQPKSSFPWRATLCSLKPCQSRFDTLSETCWTLLCDDKKQVGFKSCTFAGEHSNSAPINCDSSVCHLSIIILAFFDKASLASLTYFFFVIMVNSLKLSWFFCLTSWSWWHCDSPMAVTSVRTELFSISKLYNLVFRIHHFNGGLWLGCKVLLWLL